MRPCNLTMRTPRCCTTHHCPGHLLDDLFFLIASKRDVLINTVQLVLQRHAIMSPFTALLLSARADNPKKRYFHHQICGQRATLLYCLLDMHHPVRSPSRRPLMQPIPRNSRFCVPSNLPTLNQLKGKGTLESRTVDRASSLCVGTWSGIIKL